MTASNYSHYTAAEQAAILALYDDGCSFREIADKVGRTHQGIAQWLTRNGHHTPTENRATAANRAKAADWYASGRWQVDDICWHFHISPDTLLAEVDRRGIPRRGRSGRVMRPAYGDTQARQMRPVRHSKRGDTMTEPRPQYDATAESKPKSLTDRQRALLRYIIRYKIESGGDSPTVRDMMRGVGMSSTSVVIYNLAVLERRGLIERPAPRNGRAFSIRRLAVTGGRWVYEPPSEATP